jgi:hypothetical protein
MTTVIGEPQPVHEARVLEREIAVFAGMVFHNMPTTSTTIETVGGCWGEVCRGYLVKEICQHTKTNHILRHVER